MSEVVSFETVIALPAAVAYGVGLLAVASAKAGLTLGGAVARLTSSAAAGAREGFSDEMEAAVERLGTPSPVAGVEDLAVDGLRSLQTLHRAVEQIAHEVDGQVVETIEDASGRQAEVLAGIRSARAPSGVGVRLDENGSLVIAADPSVVGRDAIDDFRQRLETAYTTIGVLDTLQDLGYRKPTVTRQATGQHRVEIHARRS